MSLKNAAEELLKIADDIEKEAEEVTLFVCAGCNHTATLGAINQKRKEAAEGSEDNVTVQDVTVNDTVKCPACEGDMAYKATKASDPYYFDPEKKEASEEKSEEKAASEPIDYDTLKRYTA
jgi:hypothetical protein